MKGVFVLLALAAAVSAIPYKFDHDIKVNVYDVLKSMYAAAPLKAYVDLIAKNGAFLFKDYSFKFYPEEKINDVLVVYKPKGADYLHGYYVKAEDVSKYDDAFFDAVRPIYEHLNSGDYYAFTPYAAKKVVPEYFNYPLEEIFYKYYKDIDVNHDIPVVFLVPKSEVDEAKLDDYVMIAEYEVSKDGKHVIKEHFDNAKTVERRDVLYTSPYTSPYYRNMYPYAYDHSYFYKGYPYAYRYAGYPMMGEWYY